MKILTTEVATNKSVRPQFLKPDLDNIPELLKKFDHWVAWDKDKIPRNPHTRMGADCKEPSTWGSFDQAVACYQNRGFEGIGFQLKGSGIVFIDVDKCRDPKTGDLDEAGQKAVDLFRTYFEISPSGTGLHGYYLGKRPKELMNLSSGQYEWYDDGRYFTFTGRPINNLGIRKIGDEEVMDIGGEIFPKREEPKPKKIPTDFKPLSLTDQELVDKATRSKNGKKFAMLMDGDYKPLNLSKDPKNPDSQHEADLSFCTSLAWWTNGDHAQIDRIFRSSGMMRPKWESKRGATTYGEQTIQRAISQCDGGYQGLGTQKTQDEQKIDRAIRAFREAHPEAAELLHGKPDQSEGWSLLNEFGIHRVERHEVPRQPELTIYKLQVGKHKRLTRGLDSFELAQWKKVRSACMEACPTATFPIAWRNKRSGTKNAEWEQMYETIGALAETVVADKQAGRWAAIEEEVIEHLQGASVWNPEHNIKPENAPFPLITADTDEQWHYFAKLKDVVTAVRETVKDVERKDVIEVIRSFGGRTVCKPRLPILDPKDKKIRRLPTKFNIWVVPVEQVNS